MSRDGPKKHWSETSSGCGRYESVPARGPRMTRARRLLLEALAYPRCDIVHPAGNATTILHRRMVELGYEGNRISIIGLLRDAEIDGLIVREMRPPAKKTYAIRLAARPEPVEISEELRQHQEDMAAVLGRAGAAIDDDELDLDDVSGDELVLDAPVAAPGVDLAALAAAVLDQALAARAEAAKARQDALEALERAEKAEDALRHQSADTGALEGLQRLLRRKDEALRRLREAAERLSAERLDLERRAIEAEGAVVVFRGRCEELDAQATKLKRALAASEADLHKARNNGHNAYPLKEHLSTESRAELARLMVEIPARRG